jgi:predicted permease
VAAGALAGFFPALKAAGTGDLMSALKRAEHRAGVGKERRRSLSSLVIAEMAIAATLLVGGGLVLQSFQRLQGIDLGFRPDGLLTMELPLAPAKYATIRQQSGFAQQVLQSVRAVPGVLAAGMTTNVPMQRGTTVDAIYEVEGRPPATTSDVPITAHRLVTDGYGETLGLSLVKGRLLQANDRAGTLPVVVVSEQLAREAWPGTDPLGKRLRRVRAGQPGPWMTVVGVVKDVKEDRFNFRIPRPVWYVPLGQEPFPPAGLPLNLVIRSEGSRSDVVGAIRAAVRAVDPAQAIANVMPLRDQISDVLLGERFSAILLGALAAMGLLLAALGLYGVLAYSVGQRAGEIGLRIALGARPADIVRMVLGDGASLVGAGLLLGGAGAIALARVLASSLYGIRPEDPGTLAAVGAILAASALLACLIPAVRAMRIEPMTALKSQ